MQTIVACLSTASGTGPCHYPRKTPKTLFFSKNIMTSPRLPLVKAQWSFLSGIRLSREQHGPKVKVTAPPIKKWKFGTLGVLALSLR